MNRGVIIIWPRHNHIIKPHILNELNMNNYKIIQEKQIDVNKNYITNLLREIHYGKKWWEQNLSPEVEKRLAHEVIQRLEYVVVEKNDIHLHFKGFKKHIRDKYRLDKSYFHLCDPDCSKHLGVNCNCASNSTEFNNEFKKHIHMLTNKNAIHFLTHSTFHTEYAFYKFLHKYKYIIEHNKINKNDFCIDNGGILAAYGIRDTHDLDYLTTLSVYINDNDIGCENKNHTLEYERIGYTIDDIINNEDNYFYHFGMKFMSLDILKKFKFNRTHTIGTGHNKIREKDIRDYESIKEL